MSCTHFLTARANLSSPVRCESCQNSRVIVPTVAVAVTLLSPSSTPCRRLIEPYLMNSSRKTVKSHAKAEERQRKVKERQGRTACRWSC